MLGLKEGYWRRVLKVIDKSNIILEIVDSRFPEQTRNSQLEALVKGKGKSLVIVLNKCDLIDKSTAEKHKRSLSRIAPVVFVSSKERLGTTLLKKTIMANAVRIPARVGIVGYPNTGKSSIINTLKGRKVAPVSSEAGFTRGEKIIRVTKNLSLYDTPGIIPVEEQDESLLILVGAKSPSQVKDLEGSVLKLLEVLVKTHAEALKKTYGIEVGSPEETLERIAFKKNKLLKQGLPDLNNTSKILLGDWFKGKIRK